jgi:hypothetical protein
LLALYYLKQTKEMIAFYEKCHQEMKYFPIDRVFRKLFYACHQEKKGQLALELLKKIHFGRHAGQCSSFLVEYICYHETIKALLIEEKTKNMEISREAMINTGRMQQKTLENCMQVIAFMEKDAGYALRPDLWIQLMRKAIYVYMNSNTEKTTVQHQILFPLMDVYTKNGLPLYDRNMRYVFQFFIRKEQYQLTLEMIKYFLKLEAKAL